MQTTIKLWVYFQMNWPNRKHSEQATKTQCKKKQQRKDSRKQWNPKQLFQALKKIKSCRLGHSLARKLRSTWLFSLSPLQLFFFISYSTNNSCISLCISTSSESSGCCRGNFGHSFVRLSSHFSCSRHVILCVVITSYERTKQRKG